MRPARERRSGPAAGRLRLLAAAAGLALAGFAVGAVLGLLWEAPGLVAAHLLGRSQEVPLAEASGAAGEAPARTPLGAGAGGAAEGGEEALPAVSASAGGEGGRSSADSEGTGGGARPGFAVQVGAFAEEAKARELAEGLRSAGLPVYVSRGGSRGAARHRVRVGPLPSREEARRTAGRLERERGLPTWVLAREPD